MKSHKHHAAGYSHSEARGGHMDHAAKHDRIIKHLDDNDHLTERRGGEMRQHRSTQRLWPP